MPRKHVIKIYEENGYYHIYNRGVNRQQLFFTPNDYQYFTGLFGRYLSPSPKSNNINYKYPWLKPGVDLIAYCLMSNHFHLLVRQKTPGGITKLMRSLGTSYSMYFKNNHGSEGHIFESQFKASRIMHEHYLLHVTRYIHLNPGNFEEWEFSSYQYYARPAQAPPEWLEHRTIQKLFANTNYRVFCREYLPIMTTLRQQGNDPLEVGQSI